MGDSVTDGTKNGGFGWYEPLIASFPEKDFKRFALGSRTSKWLLDNVEQIAEIKADLYVVAIGCNDIRYRDSAKCAMTAEEFTGILSQLVSIILKTKPTSRFVFIAPWRSLHFDANFNITGHTQRMKLYEEYTEGLRKFCQLNNHLFLDPNPLIFRNMTSPTVSTFGEYDILKDFIHPNAGFGIAAYCRAVISCGQQNNYGEKRH